MHHQNDGSQYPHPNVMAERVIRSTLGGLRIHLCGVPGVMVNGSSPRSLYGLALNDYLDHTEANRGQA